MEIEILGRVCANECPEEALAVFRQMAGQAMRAHDYNHAVYLLYQMQMANRVYKDDRIWQLADKVENTIRKRMPPTTVKARQLNILGEGAKAVYHPVKKLTKKRKR